MRSCHELIQTLLRSTSPAEQLEAAAALTDLPMTPSSWHTAVSAIPALVEVIERPYSSTALQTQLTHALGNLADFTHTFDDQVEEVAADVIASIVKLLKHDAIWIQVNAACVLRELSLHPGNHASGMAAGAVGQLARLLNSNVTVVRATAVAALALISSTNEGAKCVAAAGAVPALVQLLGPCCSGEAAQLFVAFNSTSWNVLAVLANLAGNVADSHAALFAAGAVPRLIGLLQSDCETSQCKAAKVLGNLASSGDPENRVRVAAAGAISPLIKLLASDSEAVQVAAATTLGNLSNNVGLQDTIISAGAVAPLVRLLQSKCAVVQERAVRVFVKLTHQDTAQARSIAAAGGIPPPSRGMPPVVPTQARSIADAGGIPPLVHLLRSDSATIQANAIAVITTLATVGGTPQDVSAMKKAGALTLLTKLKGNTGAEDGVRNAAAALLQVLEQFPADSSSPSAQQGNKGSMATTPPSSSSIYSSMPLSFFTPASAADAANPTCIPSPAPSATRGTRHSTSSGKPKKLCWSCGATGVPLKKCSVCTVATYCSAVCQKADWKGHKGQCPGLKAGTGGTGSGSSASGEK